MRKELLRDNEDEPDVSSSFNGLVEGTDHVLASGEFPILMYPTLQVLAYSSASDCHVVAVNEIIFHQEMKDLCSWKQDP